MSQPILVIDNYDSFTYNLVQYIGQCGRECVVFRNDEISIDQIFEIGAPGILLSPGPCRPTESKICLDICKAALGGHPKLAETRLLGVCLGHQAIGLVAGAEIAVADKIMHGKTSQISHDRKGLFLNCPQPMTLVRYHSLVIKTGTLPPDFEVCAKSLDDDEVMGIRHKTLPVEGIQFHPESMGSPDGMAIIQNFVQSLG